MFQIHTNMRLFHSHRICTTLRRAAAHPQFRCKSFPMALNTIGDRT